MRLLIIKLARSTSLIESMDGKPGWYLGSIDDKLAKPGSTYDVCRRSSQTTIGILISYVN